MGDLIIVTDRLLVQKRAVISALGRGNGGNIQVQSITLNNSTISTAIEIGGIATEPSNITLNTRQLNLDNASQITATTSGGGNAGNNHHHSR